MNIGTHRNDRAWRHRIVREIAGVLLLKLYLLVAIYNIWFSEPRQQTETSIEQHLISPPASLDISQ